MESSYIMIYVKGRRNTKAEKFRPLFSTKEEQFWGKMQILKIKKKYSF